MKRNEAASMSISGQSTSGENQTSSDSNVRDAPREVPSLEYWVKLAQEELDIGNSLNIDGIHSAVCIDISDSMKLGDAWKQSKEFFTQFIQGLTESQEINDDEHVALSVFGRDVRVVQRLTNKYSHLQRAFDSLKIGGPSPLYGGLLMALAGVTSVTVGSVNGVKITSRIILVTDGHPTNPLLITGSDDFDPDKKKKNQVTAIQAADIISSKSVRIDCVPVGDADAAFLNLIASRTQGKVYSYKDGKMLGRITAICCHAGYILNLLRMKSLFGSSLDTDTLLEQMDLQARDQIKSLSKDEQEEVLEIAKEARKTDIFFDAIRDFEYNYEFEDPDVKLPPLGTRVRRVPDLNNSQCDDCGPGTIVGHHKNKTQVRVEWDSNEKAELYYYGEKEDNEVTVVDEPRLLQSNQLIATGCHVRRGKDWKYGDQDGTPGTIGVVVKVDDGGFVWVRWPDKRKNVYRFGASSKFDLEICRSRTADSATTPGQSSAPQPGPKSEDESCSDLLSAKSSQKGKDKIEENQNPEEDTRFIECITESNFRKIGLLLKNRMIPSKSTIIHAIKEHGYSKGIQCLLRGMCNLLRKQIPDAVQVWSGYRTEDLHTPVFVVMFSKKASIPEKMKFSEPYDNYEIVFRNEHTPNDEEERISEQFEVHANTINKEDMARVLDCIAKNTERLMNEHSNLSIIAASTVKAMGFNGFLSKPKLVESTCIVLYVPFKGIIPVGEKEFLKDIDGISTDVREGEFVFHGRKKAHKWYPKLPMGCRISTRDQQYGTLGGFVDLPGGKTGCITAAHVVLNEKERKHYVKFKKAKKERYNASLAKGQTTIEVYQPTCKRAAFGNVYQIAFEEGNKSASSVDAAVIEITDHDRTPYTGLFPSGNHPVIGFTKENPMMYNSGKTRDHSNISTRSRVVKYGCSTNITHGEMVWNGSSVRVLNTRGKSWNRLKADNISYPKFFKQMVVKSSDKINFSEPGDSGALVFIYHSSSRDLEAIGLLIGASTHRSPERMYIVTPIEAVFQKLGLKNVMFKRFPDINQGEQNPAMNELIYSRQLPESHHEISDTRINELKDELKAAKLEINEEMKEIKSEIKEIQDAVRANTISLEQIKASTSVLEQTIIGLLSKPGGDAGKG